MKSGLRLSGQLLDAVFLFVLNPCMHSVELKNIEKMRVQYFNCIHSGRNAKIYHNIKSP